jgi:hypothetical protein
MFHALLPRFYYGPYLLERDRALVIRGLSAGQTGEKDRSQRRDLFEGRSTPSAVVLLSLGCVGIAFRSLLEKGVEYAHGEEEHADHRSDLPLLPG